MPDAVDGISRDLLRNHSLAREAAPLEPSIRQWMEDRFDADLRDVRIHAGPAAAAMAERLCARAFTVGQDIYFGAGQDAPADAAGKRLVAHELVHVLQQRRAPQPPRTSWVPVGDPRDAQEIEAERIVEQVLGGRRRVVVTPDATGAIRRAIRVDADTVQMVADRKGSEPSSTISTVDPEAFLHLTRNARTAMYAYEVGDEREVSAINIKAQVDVHVDPRDDLSKWSFRFIQLAKLLSAQSVYAGAKSYDGSMMINYATPPVFPAKFAYEFALDSQEADFKGNHVMPFMNVRPPVIAPKGGGVVTVSTDMDDHPISKTPLSKWNRLTAADNYLFRAIRENQFLTAFVARDPKGTIQILAHMAWHLRWHVRYRWQAEQCLIDSVVEKVFDVDNFVKGPPAADADKITHPTSDVNETSNRLNRSAIQAIKDHLDSPFNFTVSKHYPPDVHSRLFYR